MIEVRSDWRTQMDLMQRQMDRLLDHISGSKPPRVRFSPLVWEPAIDVYETDEAVIVVVELAGVSESDFGITVDRDVFTIQGFRKRAPSLSGKRAYHQIEIAGGSFRRSIKLPAMIDGEKVKATYGDGLVEVVLPKPPVKPTRKIRIQS
jgi:HSP20 family protein